MESWRGLFLWGYLAGSSVPVRPSSSFYYISNGFTEGCSQQPKHYESDQIKFIH